MNWEGLKDMVDKDIPTFIAMDSKLSSNDLCYHFGYKIRVIGDSLPPNINRTSKISDRTVLLNKI